jgi:hypothetical protein
VGPPGIEFSSEPEIFEVHNIVQALVEIGCREAAGLSE